MDNLSARTAFETDIQQLKTQEKFISQLGLILVPLGSYRTPLLCLIKGNLG